jgi:hypothetical protein
VGRRKEPGMGFRGGLGLEQKGNRNLGFRSRRCLDFSFISSFLKVFINIFPLSL